MRISDWSSDVCSSDRPAMIRRLPAAVQEQDAGAQIAAEQQFVCAVLRALAADLTELLGESRRGRCHAWLYDWMVFPRPIGRASCRERVCQYVYISGVAVSLQQNKLTHITRTPE